MRDQQKEEREFLVKKEFIEDILNENHTIYVLIGKDSSYKAIMWNNNFLPYPSEKDEELTAARLKIGELESLATS